MCINPQLEKVQQVRYFFLRLSNVSLKLTNKSSFMLLNAIITFRTSLLMYLF